MRARIDGAWANMGASMVQLADTKHEVYRTQDGVVVKRTTTRTNETQNGGYYQTKTLGMRTKNRVND